MVSESTKPSSSELLSVAVVGGGIAGITLTIGLLRHAPSLSVTLYESAPAFGEVGAGVGFGPNAIHAMSLIDPAIREAFEKIATYNQSDSKKDNLFDFRVGDCRRASARREGDGESISNKMTEVEVGQLYHSLKVPIGQASVHRAHFVDEMAKLIPDDIPRFGKRLTNIETDDNGDVLLIFKDGTIAKHNAVIGCDGIKSRTRRIILGDDPAASAVFSGKYAYRGMIPMDQAVELLGDELARNSQMYNGYHGHVVTFPIEKGSVMNGKHSIIKFPS